MLNPLDVSSSSIAARVDLVTIANMVEPGTRVLDLGCGDGSLLRLLKDFRQVDARGVELSQAGVNDCVAKGLPVIQGDADTDLDYYPDDAFDYVILSQTLQATRHPKQVIENMLRVGQRAIVSFPNFGYWRIRKQIALMGRMPVTRNLNYQWYDTPNIHFCTIKDFLNLTKLLPCKITKAIPLDRLGRPNLRHAPWWFWNLVSENAIFMLERQNDR